MGGEVEGEAMTAALLRTCHVPGKPSVEAEARGAVLRVPEPDVPGAAVVDHDVLGIEVRDEPVPPAEERGISQRRWGAESRGAITSSSRQQTVEIGLSRTSRAPAHTSAAPLACLRRSRLQSASRPPRTCASTSTRCTPCICC